MVGQVLLALREHVQEDATATESVTLAMAHALAIRDTPAMIAP